MKLKKLFATTLALAMAIVTIPTTAAKADIVDSQTAFLNTEVYDITLPTTAGQKFYLDPQGLTEIAKTGQADIPTAAKGKIYGATTMSAINNSSKCVVIGAKYEVVVDTNKMAVVNTQSAIDSNATTKPAIMLSATATASHGVVSEGGIAGAANVLTTKEDIAAASGSGVEVKYGLDAGKYQAVTKSAIDTKDLDEVFNAANYAYKMITSGGAINITIGGSCAYNDGVDYSAFTGNNPEPLNLKITFKFYKADDTTTYIGFANQAAVYDKSEGADVDLGLVLPTGLEVTNTATLVNLDDQFSASGNLLPLNGGTDVVYSDGVLTLKSTSWNTYPNGTYALGIMMNDDPNYIYWTHITIQD